MTPPRDLLERFPGFPARCQWYLLRHAGFSGAMVWRGEFEGRALFALKRYPVEFPLERLRQLHAWWKLANGLPFIPKLHGSYERWELSDWMPGKPVRSFEPDDARLDSACAAILQVHDVLKGFHTAEGPIPAIRRRIELLQSWKPAEETGVRDVTKQIAIRNRPGVIDALIPWRDRLFPLQPVLADVHAEHVLFTGNEVTGIIDFGSMKIDHPAADAARYLGDTCPGHGMAFQRGCEHFARHYGEANCPAELVELLDRSGTLAAITFWLKHEPCPEADTRLSRMIERWHRLISSAGRASGGLGFDGNDFPGVE